MMMEKLPRKNGYVNKHTDNGVILSMYVFRFKKWLHGWHRRGYDIIPDEAPPELEAKCWVPSWRRACRVLLRNDYWCKGLGQTQPKSDAYIKYKELKASGQL